MIILIVLETVLTRALPALPCPALPTPSLRKPLPLSSWDPATTCRKAARIHLRLVPQDRRSTCAFADTIATLSLDAFRHHGAAMEAGRTDQTVVAAFVLRDGRAEPPALTVVALARPNAPFRTPSHPSWDLAFCTACTE